MNTYEVASELYDEFMIAVDNAVNEIELGSVTFIKSALVLQNNDGWYVDYGTVIYSLREMGECNASTVLMGIVNG